MSSSAVWASLGLTICVLAGLFVLGTPGEARSQDFDSVEIRTQSIGGGLYMLSGAGGNIGVSIGEDGVFLIDDQYAPLSAKIRAAVAALSPEPIRFVLNTHWHGDHTGGNEALEGQGALIFAHENVRKRMSSEQFMKELNRRVPPSPEAALPVVTFDDGLTLHLNGHQIHAFHVDPAHTDGDTIVHFRDVDVFHMGDTYFNGMYPFFDPSSGGRFSGVIAAVDRVLELAPEGATFIPGHGELSGIDELRAYRKMLAEVSRRIRIRLKRGQSPEQILAERPTADYDVHWGGGFMKPDVWLPLVVRSLAEEVQKAP